jgi:hypothetical protein
LQETDFEKEREKKETKQKKQIPFMVSLKAYFKVTPAP